MGEAVPGIEAEEEGVSKPWTCPSCGRAVKGESCKPCRQRRPEDAKGEPRVIVENGAGAQMPAGMPPLADE